MSMPKPMTGDEFTSGMELVVGVATMLSAVDVDRLMGMVERADTLGPLFEPMAYLRGGADNLRDQAELLRAVAGVQRAMARIRERATAKDGAR